MTRLLLDVTRQSSIKKKILKMKNKRLEMSLKNMIEVGTNSNDDLKKMIDNLYNGVVENRSKTSGINCRNTPGTYKTNF